MPVLRSDTLWDLSNGQRISVAASSAATSSAINSTRVLIISDTDCFITWAGSPTATDGTGSVRLPFDTYIEIPWESGNKLAAIRDTADGTLDVIPAVIPTGA